MYPGVNRDLKAASASSNPAHYLLRQKQVQIIRIEDTNSDIQIHLPGIQPNFTNVSSLNNTSSNDLYYQLKSFKCRNKFYNVMPTDVILLTSSIRYTTYNRLRVNDFTFEEIDCSNEQLPIPINAHTIPMVLTASQIVR